MHHNIPAGHVISREKGIFTHVGFSLGDGLVFHNNPERGEHVSTLAEFAKGQKVTLLSHRISGDEFHRVISRIREVLTRPIGYHPTANNCEQTLNRVLGLPANSPQLWFWLGAAAVAGLLAVRASRR